MPARNYSTKTRTISNTSILTHSKSLNINSQPHRQSLSPVKIIHREIPQPTTNNTPITAPQIQQYDITSIQNSSEDNANQSRNNNTSTQNQYNRQSPGGSLDFPLLTSHRHDCSNAENDETEGIQNDMKIREIL